MSNLTIQFCQTHKTAILSLPENYDKKLETEQ